MLTKWTQTRTSIEYTPSTTNRGQGSAKKKKKSNKSSTAESAVTQDVVIGAQFVQPLAGNDPFYQERANPTPRWDNKRRKFNNPNNGTLSGMDVEPILCLTSPHRVVFMGKGGENGGSDSSLTESKSRNYVTRPGAGSRICLRGSTGHTASSGTNGTFAGMISTGAQYEPSSNLTYAIRNGGAEVAIWTAAPSSALAGPDEEGSDVMMNGKKSYPHERKGQVHSPKMTSKIAARKRKSQLDAQVSVSSFSDVIISQRLQLPHGKSALTLTPFSIAASKGKPTLVAVGAAGCCEDGSIWVAIRFPSNESGGEFQLSIVEDSSMDNGATSAVKGTKRRKSSAKKSIGDGKGGWALLDSRVTGTVLHDKSKGVDSVLLSIQSVTLSEDNNAQVSFRNHQVMIHDRESSDEEPSVNVKKFTKQNILQLDSPETDIAVKLETNADSLSIVHRKDGERWMFTSINLSGSDGALINSKSSFLLPFYDVNGAGTVFSFGRVSQNAVAVLMKSQSKEQSGNSLLSLRIFDFRRKAELSSLFWSERDHAQDEEPSATSQDNTLIKMLHGKQCLAMITNELDGSIALLASSKEGKGSLDAIVSKLEMSSTRTQNAPMAYCSTSLASALRLVATSSTDPTDAKKCVKPKGGPNVDLVSAICSESNDHLAHQRLIDDAVEKACALLATSAKYLIELTMGEGGSSEDGPVLNGKRRKGSKASKKIKNLISWRDVYQRGSLMIAEAKGGKLNHNKKLNNGVKGVVTTHTASEPATTDDLPKRFIDVAFKETVTLLLSMHREAASAKVQKTQKTIHETTSVLVDVLRTNLISARADYDVGSLHGNVLLSVLEACSSLSLTGIGNGIIGKLHVVDAMLEHVQDIPEGALVSILKFMLRNAQVEDAVAYFSTLPDASRKGTKLSNQYKQLTDTHVDSQKRVGTKVLSEAVLDFTAKVVTYSNCNHSFLTKAMLDSVSPSGEVETLLLTLAKLLKLGSSRKLGGDITVLHSNQVSLSAGTINWISALTDAHMNTILKITNEGGLVVDKIQRAVRSAMAQSEFANEVREISDVIMSGVTTGVVTKLRVTNPRSRDTAVVPYSMERLAF